MTKPLFICFEGLDGSGKTTQALLLADQLNGFYTREPSDYPIGKLIRERLQNQQLDISHQTFQLMYAADRGDHWAGEVQPCLNQGKHVIFDRYFFSSIAFGASQGINYQWLNNVNRFYQIPDILFYIDTPVDLCLQRLTQKGKNYTSELFEKKETLEKVDQAYKNILNNYKDICLQHPNFSDACQKYIIDGSQSIDHINNQLIDIVKKSI
ncbi:dTMP kinase [Patescibacteria group bacterium]|nr:dTMP kinase [Patescibacteria group bacterium]